MKTRRSSRRLAAGVSAAGAVALGLSSMAVTGAGASARHATKLQTVKVVFETPSAGNVTTFLALNRGYFRKNGLKVQLVKLPAGPQATAALVGGSIDVGQLGLENMAPLLQGGQKMVLLTENTFNYWTLMVPKAQASKPLDTVLHALSGKTVSAPSVGGEGASFLRYLESVYGMGTTAINFTADPSNSAVLSGQSSAGMTDVIGSCVLGMHGYAPAFSFSNPKANGFPSSVQALAQIPDIGYWVTGHYAATHKRVTKEFQTAIQQTVAWSQSHVPQAVALLRKDRSKLGYPYMPGKVYNACMRKVIGIQTTTISPSQVKTWDRIVRIEKVANGLPPSSSWAIKGVVVKS